MNRKKKNLMNLKPVLNCKVFTTFFAIFFLLALSGSQALAGPFINYPGTKARAMAGAFTAIADDSSAVWFNPAGLAMETDQEGIIDVIIDWSQATSIDEKDGPLRSDESAWFVGGKYSREEFGIGLFYYNPYEIKYWAHNETENDMAGGKVNEIVQVVAIPFAVSFFDGSLKLGATIEWVYLGIYDSIISYRDPWGWLDAYSTREQSTNGIAGSLGTLITLLDNDPHAFNIKLGGIYRAKSLTDIGNAASQGDNNDAAAQLFFDKPESFDIGISFTKAFPEINSSLVIATQYGSTDWGAARNKNWEIEYEKISLGVEYAIHNKRAVLKKKALRIGYYTSNPSERGRVWNWPDVNGITYGIGLSIFKANYDRVRIGLDVTQELRSVKDDTGYSDKATLTSIAFTCSF